MTSGMESAEACCESREAGRRKQWAAGPPETVLLILDNASRISSDSTASTSQTFTASTHGCTLAAAFIAEMYKRLEADIRGFFFSVCTGASGEQEERRPRKRWERDPPEELLRLLEKAELHRAFSTFLIHRGGLLS